MTTKERIAQFIVNPMENGLTCSEQMELAHIALAALESRADAEPVSITDDMAYAFHHALSDSALGADEVEEIKTGLRAAFANVTAPPLLEPRADANSRKLFTCSACGAEGLDEPLESQCHCLGDGAHWVESTLYTRPQPAPVVPDEVSWEDVPEEVTDDDMEVALAWAHGYNACRAAMLQMATKNPAPVVVPDEKFQHALFALNETLDDCGDSERGLLLALDKMGIEVGGEDCRVAMLKGKAETVSQPLAFFDGDISSEDAEKIMNRLREMNSRPGCQQLFISEHVSQPYTLPEGYALVPSKLTSENGAKGVLSGEFSETKFINCPECFGDDECETCDGSGRIEITVPVSWTSIKEIWAKGVEHFAAAHQQEAESE